MMGDIYSLARNVVVWLGPSDNETGTVWTLLWKVSELQHFEPHEVYGLARKKPPFYATKQPTVRGSKERERERECVYAQPYPITASSQMLSKKTRQLRIPTKTLKSVSHILRKQKKIKAVETHPLSYSLRFSSSSKSALAPIHP